VAAGSASFFLAMVTLTSELQSQLHFFFVFIPKVNYPWQPSGWAACGGNSSRALFDLEEENRVFEQTDDRVHGLQLVCLDETAKPGVAFSLIKKLSQ
jgi:hypothetical protein